MKKNFTICIFIMMAMMSLSAQDIIVTNNSQKIEAKIIEVSKSEIKYKEQDNLDGPTFVLETKEISSVIYENGKVVLYNHDVEESNDVNAEIYLLSGQIIKCKLLETADDHVAYMYRAQYYTMPATKIEKVKDLQNGEETTYNGKALNNNSSTPVYVTIPYVTRKGNSYYCNGRKMRGENYEYFLLKNCTEAYNQYKSGHNVAIAGWVMFGLGLGLDLGFSWWAAYTWIPALALEIACIPTLSVGYVKMHRSADTFNASCAKRNTSYWSINASQNGIGLAWNF